MRKKDILGNFVKKPGILYDYEIKKMEGQAEIYTALITFLPGTKVFRPELDGAGCKEIVYLPLDKPWSIITFYKPDNEISGWYFDISRGNFVDENGIPCTDDIFLDLIILPDGRVVTEDVGELQEALDKNEITIEDYDHAYRVHDEIINSQWSDPAFLTTLGKKLLSEYNL